MTDIETEPSEEWPDDEDDEEVESVFAEFFRWCDSRGMTPEEMRKWLDLLLKYLSQHFAEGNIRD